MNVFFGISKRKTYGPAYICQCPSCNEVSTFDLIRITESVLVIIIPITASNTHHLICLKCDSTFQLTGNELDNVKDLIPQFGKTEKFIDGCNALTVKSLIREKVYRSTNTCDSCQEESPGNMALCWNCGEEIEAALTDGNSEMEFVVDPLFGTTSTRKSIIAVE